MKLLLVILALVLAVLHPWLVLTVEVAFLAAMAAAIGRSAGVVIPTPWRST